MKYTVVETFNILIRFGKSFFFIYKSVERIRHSCSRIRSSFPPVKISARAKILKIC